RRPCAHLVRRVDDRRTPRAPDSRRTGRYTVAKAGCTGVQADCGPAQDRPALGPRHASSAQYPRDRVQPVATTEPPSRTAPPASVTVSLECLIWSVLMTKSKMCAFCLVCSVAAVAAACNDKLPATTPTTTTPPVAHLTAPAPDTPLADEQLDKLRPTL